MKRDMDLMRKILLGIEKEYQPGDGALFGFTIDGYDMKTVAEHCQLLYQKGLVSFYDEGRGDDTITYFRVGNLTDEGFDYLEIIRDENTWNKVKESVKKNKLPNTIEITAKVAGIFIGQVISQLQP